MLMQSESPYVAHVFVCTNDREGKRKSCADNNTPLIKAELKNKFTEKGWRGKVRVSTSGCMGLCAKGANVIIYPQRIWFGGVFPENVDEIVTTVEQIMADA